MLLSGNNDCQPSPVRPARLASTGRAAKGAGDPLSGGRSRGLLVAGVVLAFAGLLAAVLLGPLRVEQSGSTRDDLTGSKGTDEASADTQDTDAEVDTAARDRAIRVVLSRRAAAVLDRDRAAFLADVDSADATFLASQEQLIDNLVLVDFTSWEYELIGRDYDRPALAATYDRPYHLPAVLVHYAIKGFDVAPVARPQVLTFVQRGARWLVASDTDADADLPETGHADPWDRRSMVVGKGSDVLVLADAQDRPRLRSLVRVADEAVRRVGQLWPGGWRRKVVVVAVRDQLLIETYFRTELQSSDDVAAIAVPAYDVVPGWSRAGAAQASGRGAGPRSRVILNPRYFDPLQKSNADLLTHEVTHVATRSRTWAGAPPWLSEGAAEYTAYRYLRPFSVELPEALAEEVRAGSVYLPTYDFYQGDVRAHYLVGFLACAYLADEYGEDMLRQLYERLGRTGNEAETLASQDRVLRSMLGVSTEEFSRAVATYAGQVSGG